MWLSCTLPNQLNHAFKTFQIGFVLILLLAGTYIVYMYFKKSLNHHFTWYLQNFTDIPPIVQSMQPHDDKEQFFRSSWKRYKQRQYEQAMVQGDAIGQVDGQLYAPLFSKGDHLHLDMVSKYVELMGNLVTIFRQDKPSVSMYIHPQDTVLDIMQKFRLTPQDVLVVDGQRLDDFNKCLLQYGIPDNWKIDALVEPRTMSFDHSLQEIFNAM